MRRGLKVQLVSVEGSQWTVAGVERVIRTVVSVEGSQWTVAGVEKVIRSEERYCNGQ